MHDSELLDQPDREAASVPIPDPLTAKTRDRRRLSLPVVSVAISVVALLSGSALFLSGYSMGRQSAPSNRAHPATRAWPSSRSGIRITRSRTRYCRLAGRSRGRRAGRHPRDDRLARRPIFGLPHLDNIARACRASGASSRGSAPRSRHRHRTGSQDCSTLRPTCRLVDRRADRGLTRRRRPACAQATWCSRPTACPWTA
jgi:hypothetical protein